MATALSTRTMALADLLPSYEWNCMTAAQRLWVKTFLESGEQTGTFDALAATRVAYPVGKNIVARAAQVQSHRKVKRILNIYFGRTDTESSDPFFDELKRAIRKSIRRDGGLSDNTVTVIRFYEKHAGKKLQVPCAE
jgi:hypothetical protein